MKKFILLPLILLLASVWAKAQGVKTYGLSVDNQEYVSIAASGTQLTSVVGDGGTQLLAMPFNFDIGETTIAQGTSIRVRSDGHVVLSNATGSHYGSSYATGSTPAIVPLLLEDGDMPAGTSGCYWKVDTTDDGLQVLVIEWAHVKQYNSAGDDFNFQLRLFENGNVQVHFGHLHNAIGYSNFDFYMVSVPINGYADAVALGGTWSSPMPIQYFSLSHGSSAVSPISGLPDSGLVVTYERPEPPCPRPRNMRITDLMPTSATLMWTPNGVSGCTYVMKYDSVPFSVLYANTRPAYYTSDSVFYLDSLLSNRHYYLYLQSDCGIDGSSSWQNLDFWTPCEALSHADLPWSEDFSAYNNYNLTNNLFNNDCWRQVTPNAAYVNWRTTSMQVYNGGTVALPPIDFLYDLEIEFSITRNGTMEMGVMEDLLDPDSFVSLYTIDSPIGSAATRTLRLSAYTGPGTQIAFRASGGSSVIDNIVVRVAQGCPAVGDVTVDSIDATSAVVSWTDQNHAGNYRVAYRPVASASPVTLTTTNTSLTLTGLIPDEDYLVMVYSECPNGIGEAVSATFHTLCALRTVPFTENFENLQDIPACWLTTGLRFYHSTYTPEAPAVCDTLASNSSRSLRMVSKRISASSMDAAWVVLPATTVSSNQLTLDFDYCVPLWYDKVELAVGITTSEGDTSGFSRLFTIRPSDGQWHRYSLDFGLYSGTPGRLALMQINHANRDYTSERWYDYGFLDNMTVDQRSSCSRPVALRCSYVTSSSVIVSWTELGSVGTYEVTCGSQSQTVVGDTTCIFSGLNPQTTYTVSVRQQCASGLTDARTATFTTECAAISSIPWSENFNSWPEDGFGECWTRHEGLDIYSSVRIFEGFGIHSICMRAEIFQGDTNRSYLVLPPVAMPSTGLAISMNVMGMNSNSNSVLLELGVMADAFDRSTFTVFDTIPFTDGGFDTWDYYEHALDGIGNGRLALRMTSLSGSKSVYIDDVALFYATSCAYPDALTVDSASQTTLSVSISDDDSVGHYRLWWGIDALTDSSDVTGYSYSISGLHHSTRYQLSAAAICPSDGTLSTRTSTSAATACGVISHTELPYEENFDDGIGLCSSFLDYRYPGNSGDRTNPNYHRGPSGKALCPNVGDNSEPFFYILPEVDSISDLALEFWLYIVRYTQYDMVTVGVMSDPADTTTFTPVQTVYPHVADDWEQHHVSLGSYSGPGRHVAMRFGVCSGTWSWNPRVDDLALVRDFSCPAPESVTVVSLTDTSATLAIQDPGQVGHYLVVIDSDTLDVSDTSHFSPFTFSLTGLSVATDYTVFVSSICADGTVTFPVQGNFTTLCGTFALPYAENFDNQEVNKMPRCWTLEESSSMLPSVTTLTYGDGQGLVGRLYPEDSLMAIATPQLHFADTDVFVSFQTRVQQYYTDSHYHAFYMPLRLQISYLPSTQAVTPSSNPVAIFDDTLSSDRTFMGYVWQTVTFHTFDIPQGDGRLLFTFFRDSTATNASFAIDSLLIYSVHHAEPCRPVDSLRVSDVTLASATVEWTPRGPATEWELHLISAVIDTLIHCDTSWLVLTDLEQGTDYHLLVRPLCDDGQLLWSDTVYFTTIECPAVEDVAVSNITATSVTVSWQAPTTGPWIIEYGPTGFNQGSGNMLTVPAADTGRMAYVVEGLQGDTSYDLYVRTLCDEGKTSIWSDRMHFTTLSDQQGIGEIQNTPFSIDISPNPAHSSVTVTVSQPAVITIFDASGRPIYSQTPGHAASQLFTLDVSHFARGVYFVTASAPDATVTRKLIVR